MKLITSYLNICDSSKDNYEVCMIYPEKKEFEVFPEVGCKGIFETPRV
jgi:hypothetical protein